jgi:tetratricopeptide (TPR) repeat protein
MSFHSLGKYPDALSDFNNLIRLNPGFSKAYYLRAMTLYKMHDYQGAIHDAMKAQQMGYKVDPAFLQELNTKLKV